MSGGIRFFSGNEFAMLDLGYSGLREGMVRDQLKGKGISDPAVLSAFREIPREIFIPSNYKHLAYSDRPVPIGRGQTISQPWMVAYMTQALGLSGGEKVLEIGTGSGFQAAILSRIAGEVYSVERIEDLAASASRKFREMGYDNIKVFIGDGTKGLPEFAPYDAIIVTAGAPSTPESLLKQLKDGGRLVIPVRSYFVENLKRYTKFKDGYKKESLVDCQFVPLIGEEGY